MSACVSGKRVDRHDVRPDGAERLVERREARSAGDRVRQAQRARCRGSTGPRPRSRRSARRRARGSSPCCRARRREPVCHDHPPRSAAPTVANSGRDASRHGPARCAGRAGSGSGVQARTVRGSARPRIATGCPSLKTPGGLRLKAASRSALRAILAPLADAMSRSRLATFTVSPLIVICWWCSPPSRDTTTGPKCAPILTP